ncbi:AMP-binding protein [Bradyrhizobium sp. WSM1253]|uniref:AMP-binding protein n=1 Tax=Bradyrhizobium sp. WSM1253 TaxID=319003 RepID=UPI00025D1721|nr:AMP-binding protein [Bradyrhizobium sp. WSM1253]EIG57810.1 acyl-CoA synthetase (AMP-forming)/AMP-acid ligase II [Bradyrhizobium sp. WSM1253]
MTERRWLGKYPDGLKADIDLTAESGSLVDLLRASVSKFGDRVAYDFFGIDITYRTVDLVSSHLASYLQSIGLQKGDRVAVMLPNVPQYPIAVAAILKAGMIVVNVNPLYTPRELEHQLKDCGAKAIVILDEFATTLDQCVARTTIDRVVLCSIGDMLPVSKSAATSFVATKTMKMVPAFELSGVTFSQAVRRGSRGVPKNPEIKPHDVAVLQYTGGTTGISKGAILSHRNLVANVLQNEAWFGPALDTIPAGEQPVTACPLPLYHILAFITSMVMLRVGGKNVLVLNPRDTSATLKTLSAHKIHMFPGLNTLFNALMAHPDFDQVDWSHLKVTTAGGMPTNPVTARRWKLRTGSTICEGYGLSEASGTVTCNPPTGDIRAPGVGLPVPSTFVSLLDPAGKEVGPGMVGEVAIKGPQVMRGYWNREEETSQVFDARGFYLTGDLGSMDEDGYLKIVDRLKDMILVSGFNVYPTEIERVVAELEGVLECAAVGTPDTDTGEAVRLVVVRRDSALNEADVKEHCRRHLTGYKQPKIIEFVESLPKSPVGKVLKKDMRAYAPIKN